MSHWQRYARRFEARPGAARVAPSLPITAWLATVFGCFAIGYIFSYLGEVSLRNQLFLKPSYGYPVMVVAALVMTATSAVALRALWVHWRIVALLALHVLMMLAGAMLGRFTEVQNGILVYRMETIVVLISCLVVFSAMPISIAIRALRMAVLFACAVNVAEFFHLLPFHYVLSYVVGRSAGFYANPNVAAFYIAAATPLICLQSSQLRRMIYLIATFIGVGLTFSRGGLVVWAVGVVLMQILPESEAGSAARLSIRRYAPVAAIAVLAIVAYLLFAKIALALDPFLNQNTVGRLQFAVDQNTKDRLYLASAGFNAFMDNPIFGLGVGYTYQWQVGNDVHNLFLMFAAEYGIIGLAWIAGFVVLILRYPRPYGIWFAGVFCASAMFTHNHMDNPAFGVLAALYLVAAARLSQGRTVVQPARRMVRAGPAAAGAA